MNYEKQIQNLILENEFLLEQLEDLNSMVKNKDEEIVLLNNTIHSAAYLQSRIDNNLQEIEQLKYNLLLTQQKAAGIELLNEALENDLLGAIKKDHKNEKKLKEMDAVITNLSIANEELEETAGMYKRIVQLKKELAAMKSKMDICQMENDTLKEEKQELEKRIFLLKQRKSD